MKPRQWALPLAVTLAWSLAGCGSGSAPAAANSSSPTSVNNQQPVQVNLGVDSNYVNGIFTGVTVCVHGSTSCQTVPDVLVDTGSVGLRLVASALTISPALIADTQGHNLGECLAFEDAYTWGPVATADVTLAGESASGIPIQLVGSSAIPGPPTACTNNGLPSQDTVAALGANGILGIGLFPDDCGAGCSTPGQVPPVYFDCPASGCTATYIPTADQVANPVSHFAQDNNGIILELPAISAGGQSTVNGELLFGIGTQTNNAIANVTVLPADSGGQISSSYKGSLFPAVVDSGSNAYFILDQNTLGVTLCSSPNQGFYCPANPATFSFTQVVQSGASQTDTLTFANAATLFAGANAAFNDLAGPSPSFVDLGLPFFFGRDVYFTISGASTLAGAGPWVAF